MARLLRLLHASSRCSLYRGHVLCAVAILVLLFSLYHLARVPDEPGDGRYSPASDYFQGESREVSGGRAVSTANVSDWSPPPHFKAVMDLYLDKLNNAHFRPSDIAFNGCLPQTHNETASPCPVSGCRVSFPEPEQRLLRIISTQFPVDKQYLVALEGHVVNHSEYADLVIVHASSANHFQESKGLLADLKEKVFPELRQMNRYSFKFFYYDLGLEASQVEELEKTCECIVKKFPFDKLPKRFSKVKSYVWKPLLFKMHLTHSRYTLWVDACVRFKSGDLTPILERVEQVGVFTARSNYFMLPHAHPSMLQYFQLEPCHLAPFYETETGFVMLKNDLFVLRAVLDSWTSCAFSPRCLCPDYDGGDCLRFLNCDAPPRQSTPYEFRCHRYDQSAFGAILLSLFDLRATGVGLRNVVKNTNQFFSFAKG